MKNIFLILLLLFTGITYSQIQTLTFQPDNTDGQDAHVSSAGTSSNYSTTSNLRIGTFKGTIPFNPPVNYDYYMRAFIKFDDLASIPSNAVVLDAKIHLSRYYGTYSSGHSNAAYLTPITSSWDESTITFSNMPSITELYVILNHDASMSSVSSSSEAWEIYDVTSSVQYFVSNPGNNEGWEMRLQEEDPSGTTYSNYRDYRSSNYTSDATKRPKLEVTYFVPLPEVTGDVTHTARGLSEGAIDASASGGSGTYVSYDWYNGQTESYFATTEDVSDLAPGWYGLKVEDDEGQVGTQIFIVGEECSINSVSINPPEEFAKDIYIESGPSGDIYANHYNSTDFRTGTMDPPSGFGGGNPPAKYLNGLWGFDIDGLWDSQGSLIFAINSATVELSQDTKSIDSSCEIYGKLITEDWIEENTCYDNAPAYSSNTSEWEYYNFTNYAGDYKAVIDVKNYISDDGEASFYSFIDLNGYPYVTDDTYYWDIHSSSNSMANNRPVLNLTYGESCACAEPKYDIDNNYFVNNDDVMCVFYNNEYNTDRVNIRIYYSDYEDLVATEVDFPGIFDNFSFGENILNFDFSDNNECLGEGMYIMEIENQKGEIQYLKFINNYSGCIPAGGGGQQGFGN